MDTLTVLTSTASATKVWKKIDGKVVAEPYGRAKHFNVHPVPVASLDNLAAALSAFEKQPNSFVIRGVLNEGSPTQGVVRRVRGSDLAYPVNADTPYM